MEITTITDSIDKLTKEKSTLIIAIDGRCGSGKSTLGKLLMEKYDATLFHMDDFFLRAEQRTEERLKSPGGNVDYERFLSEVLIPVKTGNTVNLRKIIHGSFTLSEAENVIPKKIVVIEGSYSCHPVLRNYYDLRIFLSTNKETQLSRILARSGPEKYPLFISKWIPMEELYFKEMKVAECCKIVLNT